MLYINMQSKAQSAAPTRPAPDMRIKHVYVVHLIYIYTYIYIYIERERDTACLDYT